MAAALAIDHLHASIKAAPNQHERLQRVLAQVMTAGLETAADRHGLDGLGELCIREVHALVRLHTSDSDERLAARLALALAAAIRSEADRQDPGVVRYGSLAQALADFAGATLSGDFSRAWAWRQLGIAGQDFAVSVADAAGQVLAALTARPEQAAAVLAQVADVPSLFRRLLEQGSQAQWRALSSRVVAALGGHAQVLPADIWPGFNVLVGEEPARRLTDRSRIARAVQACRGAGATALADPLALAVLVCAEAEPARLGGPVESARAWVQAVAEVLAGVLAGRTDTQAATQAAAVSEPPAADAMARAAAPATTTGAQPREDTGAWAEDPTSAPAAPSAPAPHGAAPRQRPPLLTPARYALADRRQRAPTRWGGLLYLIHLQGPVAEQVVSDPRLAERSPRWCLHQLALALLPPAADDPAALAFAGLLPDAAPPGADEPPAAADETAALLELRQAMLATLKERLARSAMAEAETEAGLVDFVCRRPAEIVADPGWLEAHFSLDDVSTEIRAAGLDLNPGWVPWLGLVLRFVYV